MNVKIKKLYSGPVVDLYELIINEKCQVREYISNLEERNKKKVSVLLRHIAKNGPPINIEKFRHIRDEIWELKSGSVRVLSFFQDPTLPKSLILTHGFPKPKKKKFQDEVKKAIKYRKEYFRIVDK